MPSSRFTEAIFCVVLAAASCLPAFAAPRIGVATMQPGEIFFERFGHNAIVVHDPALGGPVSYNFGYFDMDEDGFLGRFIRGDMRYRLVALPLAEDLAYYREVGRGVSIQWLDLTPTEAEGLAAALVENAKPENARYRYDYFLDNCSTRVRDALDRTLGGALRRQMETRSQGNTFRSEAVRLASPAFWMRLGFDVGLGPSSDRPNSLWQDAYVPMRLAASLRTAKRGDGRALVTAEEAILPHRIAPEPVGKSVAWWPWLLAGLAIAAGVRWLGGRDPGRAAWCALPAWTIASIAGALMLFIWIATEHRFGWANHNLLLLNPLCALLLPGAWRIAHGRAGGRVFRVVLSLLVASVVIAPFLHWLPLLPQRNAHWIALLVPVQLALAWTMWRADTHLRVPRAR